VAFQGNAFQHNAFQTGIRGGAADPVFPGTRVTPQQDVSRWQEVAGYALLFASALMPNANTVGAAEYNVGTHQAAVAQSQDRAWIRGTNPTLIPSVAGDVIARGPIVVGPQGRGEDLRALVFRAAPGSYLDIPRVRTLVAAPEQVDSAYGVTFDLPAQYIAVVDPPPSTLVAAPEQIDGAYARLTAPPLSYLSVVGPTATTLQAGEQVDPNPFHPPSWVHGTPDTLIPVQVGDTLPPQTWIAAPEQVDGAYALTFKTPVQYLAVVAPLAGTVVTLAEQVDPYRSAQTFGPEPPPIVAVGDVRIAGTILTHVQPDAERPSWILLISETLIPAPVVPPAVPAQDDIRFVAGVRVGDSDAEHRDEIERRRKRIIKNQNEATAIVTAFITALTRRRH
jgi:hypothetical protein